MDKTTLVLHDCFANVKKDVISAFNFNLMTGNKFNSQADVHQLVINKLEYYLANLDQPLTEEEKKLCLIKEEELLEYKSLENQLWDQVQDKISNDQNRTKIDEILVQLKNIQGNLNEVGRTIKDYAAQYIKITSANFEEFRSKPESIDKLISFRMHTEGLNEYNLSSVLINLPIVDNLKILLNIDEKINIQTLKFTHKKLVSAKKKIFNIIWPKMLDHSHFTFKDIQLNLVALYEIESRARDFSNLLFHIQNNLNYLDNPQMLETDADRQQLHIILHDINDAYEKFSDVVCDLEVRVKELNEEAKQFEIKNPVDKIYAENLRKTKENVSQRMEKLSHGTSPIDDVMSIRRKDLAEDMRLLNSVMSDVSSDINRLGDAERLLKNLDLNSQYIDTGLDTISKGKSILSSRFVDPKIKRTIRESIKELKEMKIRYRRMKEKVHEQYNKYLKDSAPGSNQLNQVKAHLEHLKEVLERAKSEGDSVSDDLLSVDSLQTMYNSYCDGTYENALLGYLKLEPLSVVEKNKSIIEQCKKILSEVKELTFYLLQQAKKIEGVENGNDQMGASSVKNLAIENIDVNRILDDVLYKQNDKNNVLNSGQKTRSSSSMPISEVKMGLEQLILAFDSNQITMLAATDKLTKYFAFIIKDDMNYSSLSDSEKDLLIDCGRLYKELVEKIQARFNKTFK